MRTYLKWLLGSLLLLAVLAAAALVGEKAPPRPHYREAFLFLLCGAALLAALFSYLELKFLPRRRQRLLDRLIDRFSAVPVGDDLLRFKSGNLDIWAELEFRLYLSPHGSYHERLRLHVPRAQWDALARKPRVKVTAGSCAGIATYIVYEGAAGNGRRAQRWLEKTLLPVLS